MSDEKVFTFAEVKEHNTKNDLHLLIHGKVYDIHKFLDEHPGGDEVLLGEAGRDATEAFEDVGHSDEARDIMKEYLVGRCDEAPSKFDEKTGSAKATIAQNVPSEGRSYTFLFPLAGLVAYLAWHFYSESQKTKAN